MKSNRNALVAQLVEQRTENPRVTGSIPVQGIFYLHENIYHRSEGGEKIKNRVDFLRLL